jgi:homoserine O-acetyltransferase
MQVVAAILSLAFQTPSYFASHVTPEGFGQFLAGVEKNLMRLDVNDVAWQIKAMMALDIYKPFGGSKEQTAGAVRARVLVIVSQQDHIVNPAPAQELAKHLKAEAVVLSGDCGHNVFACDRDKLVAAVTQFLNKDR